MNDWCFGSRFCTVRLNWAGTSWANEMNFVIRQYRININYYIMEHAYCNTSVFQPVTNQICTWNIGLYIILKSGIVTYCLSRKYYLMSQPLLTFNGPYNIYITIIVYLQKFLLNMFKQEYVIWIHLNSLHMSI